MHYYRIKLRRYKQGRYGCTLYTFPIRVRAVCFAEGYQAALHDVGLTDVYVSVHDEKGVRVFEASDVHP